ncbi:probable receptor-like protein kinase At1g11050 [Rutidosis leptorrhynchoides]|uniref:probable receptor-like protein kinase At1g11050 n=1 Tax=Rutidosis leptorrhynchoides TaxID=125765 RepID=UPI003A99ADC3
MRNLLLVISFLIILSSSSHASNSSLCPIDFNYVNTFKSSTSDCDTSIPIATDHCCRSLRSLFAIGLAQHLKQTNSFYFENQQMSTYCISSFQSHLLLLSVRQSFSTCLTSIDEFVSSPRNCAGIVNVSDWADKAGPTTVLQSSCGGDLGRVISCDSCIKAFLSVYSRLVSLSEHSSKCFDFTVLYATGIVNKFGPEDNKTATCILATPLDESKTKSKSNSRFKQNIIFAVSGAFTGILLVLGVILVYRKWNNKRRATQVHRDNIRSVKARVLPNVGAKWFHIDELDEATNGFSQRNFIGQGGFGIVYKGTLSDGTDVAVKRMTSCDIEADNDFVNEAELLSMIRHRNLLPLRGFCATSDPINGNERYLVYDYMPNGSLHDHLFSDSKSHVIRLTWPQRKLIILDVANGLSYLHNGIKPVVFHRDIKATNILLDSNMKALVADFGLAKQNRDGQTHMTTRVAGTYGYVAPEYALYGQLTEKSDVYSFGIIVLEIMSGRKVLEEVKGANSGMVLIADWAWEMVKSDRVEEVFDESMRDGTPLPKSVMNRFLRVGLLCAHAMVALRPTISDAIRMLEGDIDIPRLLDRPPPLGHEASISSFQLSNSFWSSSEGSMASSSFNNIRV